MTRAEEARTLADALEAYCERRGLARWRVSVLLFKGCRAGILKLRRTRYPHPSTLDRVRAFIASPPPPGLHKRPLGGKRVRRIKTTGVDLAAKLDALIAEKGWRRRAVSVHLFNSPHGINRLRTMKPQPKTRARVEAFIRHPHLYDCEDLGVRPRRAPVARKRAPRPIVVKVARAPLTFDEQLALVRSGKARVVPVLRIPTRGFDQSLTGNAAAMMVAA